MTKKAEEEKPTDEKKLGKIAASRPPERLPQRSEAVSGEETKGVTPIRAAQSKKTKKKIAKDTKAKNTDSK